MDIVNNSSSLYSTYISTVDHLPCDIVRSLWLVQTCNLALDKEKLYLHQLLQKHNLVGGSGSVAHDFYLRKRLVLRWHDEAVAELVSLCNQLSAHEKMVKDEIAQLQAVADTPVAKDTDILERLRQQLRNQLRDHYRENPLSSQVEALHEHERVIKDLGRVVIKRAAGNGIKIIFKLSQNTTPKEEPRSHRRKENVETVQPKEAKTTQHLRVSRRLIEARGETNEAKSEVSVPLTAKSEMIVDLERSRLVRTSARLRDTRVDTKPVGIVETKSGETNPVESKRIETKPLVRQSIKLRHPAKPAVQSIGKPVVQRIGKPMVQRIGKPVVQKVGKPTGRKRGRPAKVDRFKHKPVAQNIPHPVFQASPVQEEDTALYCFCKQRSFGDMIACDNERCPNGEWFHYKCVGLLNRVEALKYTTEKWYCSAGCREAVAKKKTKRKNGKRY